MTRVEKTCPGCGTDLGAKPHGNRKWCSDNCRKRTWDEQHRAQCVDCGTDLGVRSGTPNRSKPSPQPLRCKSCRGHFEDAQFHETASRLEQWWADGLTLREIRDHLGWACEPSGVSVILYKARARGYHLPYRYRTGKRNATKFPEQVAS